MVLVEVRKVLQVKEALAESLAVHLHLIRVLDALHML